MSLTALTGKWPSIAEIDAEIARRREAKFALKTRKQFDNERNRQRKRGGGLLAFIRYFWSVLEPVAPFVDGWPLEAMCEHLEAVTHGEITHLLMNVPPGFMKSMLVNVFWPAWEWGPMGMAHLRYVAFSYTPDLTERDNGKMLMLIRSERYQALWGDQFSLIKAGERRVSNNKTGIKFASSIGGVGTGERGDRVILDDPHNVKTAESETQRSEVVRWFRESMSNRLNDVMRSAVVIIMQRVHEEDVSGFILAEEFDYVHLCIPMRFDPLIYPVEGNEVVYEGNAIGWIDPRALDEDGVLLAPSDMEDRDGDLAWPARFPLSALEKLEREIGPFATAGQYQQRPMPRKGAIFDIDWWQLWEPPNGNFPLMDFIIASLDSAFTEKEENDPSGFTVWGVWRDDDEENAELQARLKRPGLLDPQRLPTRLPGPKLMLMHAWRKHLIIHGPDLPRGENETYAAWVSRTQKSWGLVEWVAHSCRRFNVDMLLVEAKASGIDVINEMKRLHSREGWGLEGAQAPRDKVARALAVQPTFSQGIVYAPARDWAETVKTEMATFPKGRYKDLTDSSTHAIQWLRKKGLIQRPEEIAHLVNARAQYRKKPVVLYAT